MSKAETVVAYQPGCYGTYVAWLLAKLKGIETTNFPFHHTGSSHSFRWQRPIGMSKWRELENLSDSLIYRVHPKIIEEENIRNSLEELSASANEVILIVPDRLTELLWTNNYFYKIWDSNAESKIFKDLLEKLSNWPDSESKWVRREFLSLALEEYNNSAGGFNENLQDSRWTTISVSDLLYNFKPTVESLGYTLTDNLISAHHYNVSKQHYAGDSFLIDRIIECTLENTDFSWNDLSLVSESWIQLKLRKMGYEIECHELDIFPTNSLQLADLLYKA